MRWIHVFVELDTVEQTIVITGGLWYNALIENVTDTLSGFSPWVDESLAYYKDGRPRALVYIQAFELIVL